MKKILIFVDRDGTLVYDDKYFLGSQKNWKSKIKLMPGTIQGLKLLSKLPNSSIHLITNQPGVAIKDLPLLTKRRAIQVNKEIIKKLRKKGISFGQKVCPHANLSYVKEHSNFKFEKNLVDNKCPCLKPKPGMIISTLKEQKLKKSLYTDHL